MVARLNENDSVQKEKGEDVSITYGKILANPPPGEEVVISGIAGKFPESENVYEFQYNLLNKVNMVTADDRRWDLTHPEIPQNTGKLKVIDRFDPGYFGIPSYQIESMDPVCRMFLEKAIEAVMDAGVHPKDLEGTRTGVFIGACYAESEKFAFFQNLVPGAAPITGCLRSMISHRISYFLKINGPSIVMDTACSSSSYALENAYRAIRSGLCDAAIVGGGHLCLHPIVSLQFKRLGVLSDDGSCKVFDKNANGYARSEAIAVLFLQKSKDAKRIYSKVIHAKVNCDGFKEQGITFPSSQSQKELLEEFYQECPIQAKDLSYMEAHGTGTSVGDPEEIAAVEEVFLRNRKDPLLIGSVKSAIGHSEPAAGVCAITKCIIAMETGLIPPNINYTSPKETIKGLVSGRLKVVTEPQPFPNNHGLIGVDSFGFGGANSHALLQWNKKSKVNKGLPTDDLPRLVNVSGRTPEGVLSILNDVNSRPLDAEYVWLLQNTFKNNYDQHYYRGFSLISKSEEIARVTGESFNKQPLYLSFADFKDPKTVGSALFKLPLFEDFVRKIHEISSKKQVKNDDHLSNFTIHLGIAYLLKELKVQIEDVLGYNETIRAYIKDTLSLEKALSSEISRSKLENGHLPKNAVYNKSQNLILNLGDSGSGTLSFGSNGDILANFLQIIGRLYIYGHNPQTEKLYPKISGPVSRGTPMISPLIKWRHDKQWFVCKFTTQKLYQTVGEQNFIVSLEHDEWTFVQGHVIDGRNLFPATGYLYIVWVTLGKAQPIETAISNIKIVFENVRFVRATTVPKAGNLELTVMLQKGSGNFEVIEGDSVVVSGRAFIPDDISQHQVDLPKPVKSNEEQHLSLNRKDIYKELRLRGYNYSGAFKKLSYCDNSASVGKIIWSGEEAEKWVGFTDNILQLKILHMDSRSLYVPTFIEKLSIDPEKHLKQIEDLGEEEPEIPVYIDQYGDTIRSGGIEIRGLMASSISRKKPLGEPVLEKYDFVPNEGQLTLSESLRVDLQIILDNTLSHKVKGVEVVDEETTGEILSPLVLKVLEDIPLIQPDLKVFSKEPIDANGISVEDKKLVSETECLLVIGSKVLQRTSLLQQAVVALGENGYLLSREPIDYNVKVTNLDVMTTYIVDDKTKLVLLRKPSKVINKLVTINVDDDENFSFLPTLQESLKSNVEIILYGTKPLNGILGLVNCLRREPDGQKVRGIFTMDINVPKFDVSHPFYKEIINKKMHASVFKNGQWGTYRHLLIPENEEVLSEHCYSNVTVKGDLSSFRWIEGRLSTKMPLECEEKLVKIYYAALNFRDVMTASGRLNVDVITKNRLEQDCIQGIEFSGRDLNGRRVMGMVKGGALATFVAANSYLLWPVPDNWSLEEAATVPCVYGTVVYGLLVRGTLKKGMSILIHAGSGGIGLAAISIALYHECEVFTTVGTKEKRDFLLKRFPQLKANYIGNSRDTSFENMIKKETKGRGVDIVLNSLAGEKLMASAQCLAHGGRFVEIGKFDLANNTALRLILLKKEASFHGVMLDELFKAEPASTRLLTDLLLKGIQNGSIKPLVTTVFKKDEVEQAFRYMATGKHIGKVVINVHQEETEKTIKPKISLMKGIPRYYCDPKKVQIITGGLGGFGLELADWLILRGAKQLILSSRSGIKTGYQAYRLRLWKSYGVMVKISKADITTREGCKQLLESALEFGQVESIFNLAVVLRDAIFDNQTKDAFQTSFGPKAYATEYFDELTRQMCPNLRDFVIFSSVSCGRGNAGQTNYGMANSVMERICEKRQQDGYPALAIEWGAVGDVGLAAEMLEDHSEMEIGGTLQQRITNCLEVMDTFLRQKSPIVSSIVVAEKKSGVGSDNLLEAVAGILGIRDVKLVSFQSTLAELGMDSMTAVEIKTTLEREFEVFLTPQDIRGMTFARLQEIQNEREESVPAEKSSNDNPLNLGMILGLIKDEETTKLPVVQLLSKAASGPRVPFFPGMDGVAKTLEILTQNLSVTPLGYQYSTEDSIDTIQEMAKSMLPSVESELTLGKPFQIVAYSFGVAVALEVVALLEAKGYSGKLICIDGSPDMVKNVVTGLFHLEDENLFQTSVLCHMLMSYLSAAEIARNYERIFKATNFEEKLQICGDIMPEEMKRSFSFLQKYAKSTITRVLAIANYTPSFPKLNSKILLFKTSKPLINGLSEDYQLRALCSQEIQIRTFEGDHYTILENPLVADIINEAVLSKEAIANNIEKQIPKEKQI